MSLLHERVKSDRPIAYLSGSRSPEVVMCPGCVRSLFHSAGKKFPPRLFEPESLVHLVPLYRTNIHPYRQTCHICKKVVNRGRNGSWPELYSDRLVRTEEGAYKIRKVLPWVLVQRVLGNLGWEVEHRSENLVSWRHHERPMDQVITDKKGQWTHGRLRPDAPRARWAILERGAGHAALRKYLLGLREGVGPQDTLPDPWKFLWETQWSKESLERSLANLDVVTASRWIALAGGHRKLVKHVERLAKIFNVEVPQSAWDTMKMASKDWVKVKGHHAVRYYRKTEDLDEGFWDRLKASFSPGDPQQPDPEALLARAELMARAKRRGQVVRQNWANNMGYRTLGEITRRVIPDRKSNHPLGKIDYVHVGVGTRIRFVMPPSSKAHRERLSTWRRLQSEPHYIAASWPKTIHVRSLDNAHRVTLDREAWHDAHVEILPGVGMGATEPLTGGEPPKYTRKEIALRKKLGLPIESVVTEDYDPGIPVHPVLVKHGWQVRGVTPDRSYLYTHSQLDPDEHYIWAQHGHWAHYWIPGNQAHRARVVTGETPEHLERHLRDFHAG